MAERTKALVEKELLQWARKSASLSLETAAKAAHVPLEKLEASERGEDGPSIPELKKLAGAYKRPVSVFFLRAADRFPSSARLPASGRHRRPGIQRRPGV